MKQEIDLKTYIYQKGEKIMGIIIVLVLIFILWCICDSASFSMSIREHERERREEYEKEVAAARKQYPKIENWSEHPLFEQASAFLVSKIDYAIRIAKKTPCGAGGGLFLGIEVRPSEISIIGRCIEPCSFYYSDQGYDRIKVGYTTEETMDACDEFSVALSTFLSDYYASRENIRVGLNVDCRIGAIDFWGSGKFSVDLKGVQPKLKQI